MGSNAGMNISTFEDLLLAARAQTQPQRLLLVFAGATLPDDATPEQRARFDAGESGELAPLMCVDKDPFALDGFDALAAEALAFGQPWVLVFAAALSGSAGQAPAEARVADALQRMVEAVRAGELGNFIPFDRQGHAVQMA
jgi:hypothetical protein